MKAVETKNESKEGIEAGEQGEGGVLLRHLPMQRKRGGKDEDPPLPPPPAASVTALYLFTGEVLAPKIDKPDADLTQRAGPRGKRGEG